MDAGSTPAVSTILYKSVKSAKKPIGEKMARTKKPKVVTGNNVTLHYKGSFADGETFDSSYERGQPISTIIGSGQLLGGFESALIGMKEGQTKTVNLPAEDAYGQPNPQAFTTVERTAFPTSYDFIVGQQVQGTREDGSPLIARIAAFSEEVVTLDMNHPLAGKDLNFEIELVGIGEAVTEVAEEETAD